MIRRPAGLFAAVFMLCFTPVSMGETIELVTYYPATAGGNLDSDRIHAGRATIGDPYSLDNPADADLPNGTLLVAGSLGVGTDEPQRSLNVFVQDIGPFGDGIQISGNAPGLFLIDGVNPPGQVANQRGGFGLAQSDDNYGVGTQAGDVSLFSQVGSLNFATSQEVGNPPVRMTITPQGRVGIGTTAPDASAALQVDSAAGGLLPPRLTTAQRDAIAAPAQGLTIYNTTANRLESYNGAGWGRPGEVVQVVFLDAGNGSTSSTSLQPVGNPISITPRSANSTLIVEATFFGAVPANSGTGANTAAYYRLREVTGAATNLGSGDMGLSAGSANSSPGGIAAIAPCSVRALVGNAAATARSFRLYARSSTSSGTAPSVSANAIVFTVTEVQN